MGSQPRVQPANNGNGFDSFLLLSFYSAVNLPFSNSSLVTLDDVRDTSKPQLKNNDRAKLEK
jgi:hypothetical protein